MRDFLEREDLAGCGAFSSTASLDKGLGHATDGYACGLYCLALLALLSYVPNSVTCLRFAPQSLFQLFVIVLC